MDEGDQQHNLDAAVEAMHGSNVAAPGSCLMLHLEQKSMGWITNLVAKLSGPKDLLVDFCAGTIAVTNLYMLLSEHRNVVRGKRVKVVLKKRYQVEFSFT